MIAYAQLRAALAHRPKFPGCRQWPRSPLVSSAFPGAFNMSFTEHPWLQELGGFLDWDRDFVFSTIQSCVRLGDFAPLASDDGARYLGVFELADVYGAIALARAPDYRALHFRQVAELVGLLRDLGIRPEKVHATYSGGGPVAELSAGRYQLDAEIPADDLSREAFLHAGLPAANLQPDATRATLLALHVHRPTPWGYRNEIYVDVGDGQRPALLEVATAEYFLWRPVFAQATAERRGIIGLEPLESGASIVGCGLERLAMAANRLPRIHQVDYLRPFYQALEAVLSRPLEPADYYLGESIRVLHRIYADLALHAENEALDRSNGTARLSMRRRKKLAVLKRSIPVRITDEELGELLRVHSSAQPWHAHLDAAVEATIQAVRDYQGSSARGLVASG